MSEMTEIRWHGRAGRFKHLFATENRWLLKKVLEEVDAECEKLRREANCG